MHGALLGPAAPGVTQVELDGRISLHTEATREVRILDVNATAVWRLLDGTRTLPEVVEELAVAYGRPAGELEADVADLVSRFRSDGLLAP